MKRRILLTSILGLTLSIVLTACTPNQDLEEELETKDSTITELEQKITELETELEEERSLSQNLTTRAIKVVNIIEDRDMEELAAYIHPEKGVRFSPYEYVDVESDQVFISDEIEELLDDEQEYTWGNYDGSGESIELNFVEYYERFIYDVDFANPQMIGNNVAIGSGNTINNIEEVYPNGEFIEFHFQEIDPEYVGMDWKSLRLVFEEYDEEWYLVGIVHGEWTI